MKTGRKVLAFLTSAIGVYFFAGALNSVLTRDPTSVISTSYGSHFQYLTILSLATTLIQTVLSSLALLTSLRSLQALQNWVLIIGAPLEIVVASIYWPLKFTYPGLLKDKRIAVNISMELDRRLHLYPAIIEFLSATVFAQTRWRQGTIIPLLLFSAVGGGYWMWVETTFKHNGFYPYPIFAIMNDKQKAQFIGAAVIIALITFKAIQRIQKFTMA